MQKRVIISFTFEKKRNGKFEPGELNVITMSDLLMCGFETLDDKTFNIYMNSGNKLSVIKSDRSNWRIDYDDKHLFISIFTKYKFQSLLIGLGFIS